MFLQQALKLLSYFSFSHQYLQIDTHIALEFQLPGTYPPSGAGPSSPLYSPDFLTIRLPKFFGIKNRA
jgi:hypothetical protein